MNKRSLRVGSDLAGQDVLFDPTCDILIPLLGEDGCPKAFVDGTPIEEGQEWVDLIVRAVNSHADLLAAAETTLDLLDGLDPDEAEEGCWRTKLSNGQLSDRQETLRAAIRAAKGD